MTILIDKVKVVCDLAADGRLSSGQYRVAVALILYFHNTTSGECFPSYRQLAAAANESVTTAKRTTRKLREMGIIDFEKSSGGRNRRNSYRLKGVPSGPFNEKRCPQRTPNGVPSGPAYIQRKNPRYLNRHLESNGARAAASAEDRENQKRIGEQLQGLVTALRAKSAGVQRMRSVRLSA